MPNALLPLVTLSAIQFGAVVGGAITIETIFSWPGLGELELPGDPGQGLPRSRGHVPGLLGGGDLRQPARRLPLLLPRPAGAVDVSAEQAASAIVVLAEPERPRSRPRQGVRHLLLGTWRGRFGLASSRSSSSSRSSAAARALRPECVEPRHAGGPDWSHILGTTESGADVFSQLLVGARVSIVVGFAAALISAVLGSAVGLAGGYFGGGPTDRSTRWRTGSWSSRHCRS